MQTHLLYKQASLLGPDGFSLWAGGGVAFLLGRWGDQADLVLEKVRTGFVIMSFLLLLAGFGSVLTGVCTEGSDEPQEPCLPPLPGVSQFLLLHTSSHDVQGQA